MRRKASRNNKNAICNAIENTCKQKQNRHTLMVGWGKPVTRYNKNNSKKNKKKNLHCHKECSTLAVRTYAGDQECEREEEFEASEVARLQPLSR